MNFLPLEAMIQAWAEDPGLPGPSPGGAASMLKITRQGVYRRQTGFLGHDSAQRTRSAWPVALHH